MNGYVDALQNIASSIEYWGLKKYPLALQYLSFFPCCLNFPIVVRVYGVWWVSCTHCTSFMNWFQAFPNPSFLLGTHWQQSWKLCVIHPCIVFLYFQTSRMWGWFAFMASIKFHGLVHKFRFQLGGEKENCHGRHKIYLKIQN